MKILMLFLCLGFAISCQISPTKNKLDLESFANDTLFISNYKTDSVNNHIVFLINDLDTIQLTKKDLYIIENSFPEITNQNQISHPDTTYIFSQNDLKNDQKSKFFDEYFSSLSGKDLYFNLYSYYLKNKNGINTYEKERNTLKYLLLDLNNFLAYNSGGGTYYAHMTNRIPAYVEYEIYKLKNNPQALAKLNSKKKKSFINVLKKMGKTNNDVNYTLVGSSKNEIRLEFNRIIKSADELITNDFYLNNCFIFIQTTDF